MTAYTPEPTPSTPVAGGAPVPPPAGVDYPGKTLGIVGLVLAFVFSLAGIIVSAIARSQSAKAGYKNTIATVGLILSIIFFVLAVIIIIVNIVAAIALVNSGYVTY